MFLAMGAAAVALLFGPIGSAIARRLWWRPGARMIPHRKIEEIDASVTAELEDLREPNGGGGGTVRFRRAAPRARPTENQLRGGATPMITREDIQSFLDRLDGGSLAVREIEPNLWVARTPDDSEVVVHYAPPVVILRVRVMELPASEPRRGELFRQLLEFNARELVHGSYGLEGDHVVLTDTLELENLDYNEFEASFDSVTLALASHLSALAPYRER